MTSQIEKVSCFTGCRMPHAEVSAMISLLKARNENTSAP